VSGKVWKICNINNAAGPELVIEAPILLSTNEMNHAIGRSKETRKELD
jgi:hypothetical protein